MTCIVGLESRNTVYIGGDSAATAGDLSQMIIAEKKVFKRGEFVFGICGTPKVMDTMRFNLVIPENDGSKSDRAYLSSDFIAAFREQLKVDGVLNHDPQHGEYFQGAFLMGYRGKLYRIESNLQIVTAAYGFDSVGSGADIALGNLHASKGKFSNPKKRIVSALEASAINNAGVRPPFAVVDIRKGKTSREK